jgi:hypothetical protein
MQPDFNQRLLNLPEAVVLNAILIFGIDQALR